MMFPFSQFGLRKLRSTSSRLGRAHLPRVGYRPFLELLENRLAPATLTVNEIADNNDFNSSTLTGSLRGCIEYANGSSGNTINFDPNVFATPQTITLSQALNT